MKRKLGMFALVCIPALLVALGGVYFVQRERSRICEIVRGQPPCTCGCRDAHVQADAEVTSCTDNMATEAGFAIMALLVLVLVGSTVLFATDARRARRQAAANKAFVADISHRLRTPLTGIRLNADLLNESRLQDDGERKDAVSVIAEEAKQLTALVERLLDHVARP